MRSVLRRAAVVGVASVAAVLSTAASASAYQVIHYTGLYVYEGGTKLVGEIDYTTKTNNLSEKVNNDAGGDRQRIKAPWRDRAAGNGRSVYTSVNWAKNGTFCYLSGIGEGAQASCGSGWNGYGSTRSQNIQDSSWWFSYHNKSYDLYSDSIRGQLRVCEDISFQTDPCSGSRYLGISY
jgi:hypothetical protein